MKKSLMVALLGLLLIGGMTKLYAQDDSAKVAEEPKDTISIDNSEPVYYEEPTAKAAKESSNTMTYAIIGIVLIGGVAFYFISKKKKDS
jgi:LPXTG-motif cell wall-anchored protein